MKQKFYRSEKMARCNKKRKESGSKFIEFEPSKPHFFQARINGKHGLFMYANSEICEIRA